MTLGALLVPEPAAGANIFFTSFSSSTSLSSMGKSCERRRARGVAASCMSGAALTLESVDNGPIVHSCVHAALLIKATAWICFPSSS